MRTGIVEIAGRVLLRGVMGLAVPGLYACGSSSTPAGVDAPIAVAQTLSHTGPWFTDEQGRVVVLHGTNMINKLSPYYPAALGFGEKDLSFLAQNGFNGIRLGFIWAGVEPSPGQYDDAYIDQIAALAAQAESYGLQPVVDFHQDGYSAEYGGDGAQAWASISYGIPGSPLPPPLNVLPGGSIAFENFWLNTKAPDGIGLQDHFAAAWQHVAERMQADSHIVFELYNEPSPGIIDFAVCAQPVGCPEFDIGLLAPFYKKVLQAVRKVDATRLVMVEPNALFDLGMNTWLPSMDDPQVGFAFHDYCVLGSLGISLPAGIPIPSLPCALLMAIPLTEAQLHFDATGEPSLMDELGAGDTDDDVAELLNQADQQMLSWNHWAYWAQDFGKPSTYGLIDNLNDAPAGSNIKQPLLTVLSRPSPRLIAGTPQSWSWNSSASTFKAAYATARADGSGSFPAGAVSIFFVHPRFFPNGYQVQVTGGAVVSAAGATWLQIAALAGADAVTLTITPATAN
jgi:endoglycosylceramidase